MGNKDHDINNCDNDSDDDDDDGDKKYNAYDDNIYGVTLNKNADKTASWKPGQPESCPTMILDRLEQKNNSQQS